MLKLFLTELLGSNTTHWSKSRVILAGAALCILAVLSGDYLYAGFGVVFVILRFNTRNKV